MPGLSLFCEEKDNKDFRDSKDSKDEENRSLEVLAVPEVF
jgi:hypothetical protein